MFAIVTLSLPLVILLLAEIGLRVFHYGGNLDLFVLQSSGRADEYVLNRNFTQRYVFKKGITPPLPLSQTFPVAKSNTTYRIFCLGESTVQGFPYPPSAAFPAVLKNILSVVHPDRNIEVVNCGITAIASYSVLDMCEEIVEKYQPDLLVVYTGHNEFYGVFGQASRLSLFDNRTLQRLFLKMQNSRLFLLARNVVSTILGDDIGDDPDVHRGTFMANVVKDAGIPLSSEMVKRTERIFEQNLAAMIEEAKEHHTDIIVCSLAENLKDFAPFASMHSDDLSTDDTTRWNELISAAAALQTARKYQEAIEVYRQALKIDSAYADTHFQLAQCYYHIHSYDLAKRHFVLANDLDVIRFRAPSSFHAIANNVCHQYHVPFVDVDKDFSRISPGAIVGNELMTEHVHPNQQGYVQIAKSISQRMSELRFIAPVWDWSRSPSDSAYCAMSNLTPLDKDVVSAVLARLTTHWPFRQVHAKAFERIGNEETERLATTFVNSGEQSLERLHIEYGASLQTEKRFDEALAEYKAILAMYPAREAYNRIGQTYLTKTEIAYRDMKDFASASESFNQGEYYFLNALERWPDDVELNLNLGILYVMRNDRQQQAEERFKRVLAVNPKHQSALTLLSQIYVHGHQPETAEQILRAAIDYYPTDSRFYTECGIVLMQERKFHEAKRYFEKAISLSDDAKAKHYMGVLNTAVRSIN